MPPKNAKLKLAFYCKVHNKAFLLLCDMDGLNGDCNEMCLDSDLYCSNYSGCVDVTSDLKTCKPFYSMQKLGGEQWNRCSWV